MGFSILDLQTNLAVEPQFKGWFVRNVFVFWQHTKSGLGCMFFEYVDDQFKNTRAASLWEDGRIMVHPPRGKPKPTWRNYICFVHQWIWGTMCSAPNSTALSLFIMVCHGLSWFITVYHGLSSSSPITCPFSDTPTTPTISNALISPKHEQKIMKAIITKKKKTSSTPGFWMISEVSYKPWGNDRIIQVNEPS